MIDQGEIPKPENPFLTPEHIEKSDRDIATISSLSKYASSRGGILEISGGFAVEAHFGGRITRPHGDIDAVFWLADSSKENESRAEIHNLLSQEETLWRERPNEKNREHFIEFLENAQKEFLRLRRIELYMFDKKYKRETVTKNLLIQGALNIRLKFQQLEKL